MQRGFVDIELTEEEKLMLIKNGWKLMPNSDLCYSNIPRFLHKEIKECADLIQLAEKQAKEEVT